MPVTMCTATYIMKHINIKNMSVKIGSCSPFIAQPSVLVAYSDKMNTDMTVFIRFLSNQRIREYLLFHENKILCSISQTSSTVPLGMLFQIYYTAMESN